MKFQTTSMDLDHAFVACDLIQILTEGFGKRCGAAGIPDHIIKQSHLPHGNTTKRWSSLLVHWETPSTSALNSASQ